MIEGDSDYLTQQEKALHETRTKLNRHTTFILGFKLGFSRGFRFGEAQKHFCKNCGVYLTDGSIYYCKRCSDKILEDLEEEYGSKTESN